MIHYPANIQRPLSRASVFIRCAFVIFILLFPYQVMAMDADNQFLFSDRYFSQDQFGEAIPEWRRFLFFFPEDHRRNEAMYKLGVSYLKTGRYADARLSFQAVLDTGDTALRLVAAVKLSETFQALGEFDAGIGVFDHLIAQCEAPGERNRALYEAGWYCIGGGRPELSKDYFGQMDSEHRLLFHADTLMAALETDRALPEKNAAVAGLSSVFPGCGYLYLGRYRDSLASFFITSMLAWATYEAADNEQYALGTLLGITALGFYGGGMVGAMNGAHKHNRRIKQLYLEDLQHKYRIHLGAALHRDGALYIGCHLRF